MQLFNQPKTEEEHKKQYGIQPGAILASFIILLGIALRLTEFFHYRDLMIDEANVARNLYADHVKDVFKLQFDGTFAPPLFLLLIKGIASVLGYGEKALRLYPMLAGCAALLFFYKLLLKAGCKRGFWLPLALFAISRIYILYSNDLKQYLPDALITILLILLAASLDINKATPKRFTGTWAIAGATAVWLSMPSVFILFAIGLVYFVAALRGKNVKGILVLSGIVFVWLLSFGCYYMVVLKAQLADGGLLQFHDWFFFDFKLSDPAALTHDKILLNALFEQLTGNNNIYCFFACLALMAVGIARLAYCRQHTILWCSLIPLVTMIVASGLKHFTLLDRVCIFAMPLVLVLIGAGLEAIYALPVRALGWAASLGGLFIAYSSNQLSVFKQRYEVDELTTAIQFAKDHKVSEQNIFVYAYYRQSLNYYQEVYPAGPKRDMCRKVTMFHDGDGDYYKDIAEHIHGRAAFVYFWVDDGTYQVHKENIMDKLQPVDSLKRESYSCRVFEKR